VLYLLTDLAKFSLDDYLQTPEYKCVNGIKIALQISEGLVFLHSNKIIHRDLKPSNILLNENLEAKICDLGLSRSFSKNSLFQTPAPGTPFYTAPEMIKSYLLQSESKYDAKPYDEKVDIFSFGVLLWRILHPQTLCLELPAKIRPSIAKNIDQRISDLVASCWDEKPENRPTAVQVCESIRVVLG